VFSTGDVALIVCAVVTVVLGLLAFVFAMIHRAAKEGRERCYAVQEDVFPRLDKLEVRVGVLEKRTKSVSGSREQ
jgi:hypothetical protein